MPDDFSAPPAHPTAAQRRALRAIAGFEALKGFTALTAGLGLLNLVHHDLHHLAVSLIDRIGLRPQARYPAMLLDYVDVLHNTSTQTLLLVVLGYVGVRLTEAWGLWHERTWGEWLAALSGALYVPFEVRHLLHDTSWVSVLVLVSNLTIVAYLGWQLWQQRRAHRQHAAARARSE